MSELGVVVGDIPYQSSYVSNYLLVVPFVLFIVHKVSSDFYLFSRSYFLEAEDQPRSAWGKRHVSGEKEGRRERVKQAILWQKKRESRTRREHRYPGKPGYLTRVPTYGLTDRKLDSNPRPPHSFTTSRSLYYA